MYLLSWTYFWTLTLMNTQILPWKPQANSLGKNFLENQAISTCITENTLSWCLGSLKIIFTFTFGKRLLNFHINHDKREPWGPFWGNNLVKLNKKTVSLSLYFVIRRTVFICFIYGDLFWLRQAMPHDML